jgi:hypothetical protein
VPFDLMRDYETKVFGNEQGNDLVLLFDDGTLPPHTDAVGSSRQYEQRPKGVYYKAISRRHILKRKRVDVSLTNVLKIRLIFFHSRMNLRITTRRRM